ncbi:hypothetical protein ARMGADRAFT_591376 [Armillaria gallica]|uniref:Uncharacterized protein n=1 Tax=Armillaria gallica TaxID=47427 RepID=A0A2H3DC48_ARMGA|nr:hypothetical protein ARMGADRAFT_591376 [Armillaria gallica]
MTSHAGTPNTITAGSMPRFSSTPLALDEHQPLGSTLLVAILHLLALTTLLQLPTLDSRLAQYVHHVLEIFRAAPVLLTESFKFQLIPSPWSL